MKPAQESLAADLERLSFSRAAVPVVTNVDAALTRAADALRDALVAAGFSAGSLARVDGVVDRARCRYVCRSRPGKVLSGLMRQISREVKMLNVEDAASLEAANAALAVDVIAEVNLIKLTEEQNEMPDQEIENKVKQIIVDELGVDENEVTPNARFIDDLGADSLDTVELVMRFEEEFGIEIPDEDAEKIQSVRDAYNYIDQHKK